MKKTQRAKAIAACRLMVAFLLTNTEKGDEQAMFKLGRLNAIMNDIDIDGLVTTSQRAKDKNSAVCQGDVRGL